MRVGEGAEDLREGRSLSGAARKMERRAVGAGLQGAEDYAAVRWFDGPLNKKPIQFFFSFLFHFFFLGNFYFFFLSNIF